MTRASKKVDAMLSAKVDLRPRPGQVGAYPDLHEKLALELATEYQIQEGPSYCVVSWANQERAQNYFNEHGLAATLDHMLALRTSNEKGIR